VIGSCASRRLSPFCSRGSCESACASWTNARCSPTWLQVVRIVNNEATGEDVTPAPRTAPWLACGLLLLLFTAYAPIFEAGFIWDDDAYVLDNLALRSVEGLRQIWAVPSATPQYYPIVFSSFWLEYQIWQLAPLGYHVDNLLLHGLCALLLWRLLLRLGIPGAWLAAAVFALHPVHVESVAWITERKNVLSGVFYMASMLALFRFVPGGDAEEPGDRAPGPDWRWYAVAWVAFVAALLSKTVTASLPAAFLVLEWWRRGRLSRVLIASMIPMLAIGAAAGLTTAWLETVQVGAMGEEWSLSAWERVLVAVFYYTSCRAPTSLAFTPRGLRGSVADRATLGLADSRTRPRSS
jgi:hypothetical protein